MVQQFTSETKGKEATSDGLYVDTDIELGDDGETISYSSGQAHSSSSSKVCIYVTAINI